MRRQCPEQGGQKVLSEIHARDARRVVPDGEGRTGNQPGDEHRDESVAAHLPRNRGTRFSEVLQHAFAKKAAGEIRGAGPEHRPAHRVRHTQLPAPDRTRGEDEDAGGNSENAAHRVGNDEDERREPKPAHPLHRVIDVFAREVAAERREIQCHDAGDEHEQRRDLEPPARDHERPTVYLNVSAQLSSGCSNTSPI